MPGELAVAAALALGDPAAEQLLESSPELRTVEIAADHLSAATVAGSLETTDVPASLLLAIAWHESRFSPGETTREPGGEAADTGRRVRVRWSCGVMTPTPNERCRPEELTLIGGYVRGALHLRHYLDVYRGDVRRALWAYAGGGQLARACARGRRLRACRFAGDVLRRERDVARALARPPRQPVLGPLRVARVSALP